MIVVRTAGGETDPESALKSDYSVEHILSFSSYKQYSMIYVEYLSDTQ